MLDAAFQAACQRYAHGNGSSGAIAAAAIAAYQGLGVGETASIASDPANPFRDLRDDTHQVIEAMLYDLQASSDHDQVADWIDQWRAARGTAGMNDWRWWIGGDGADIYALDFATRDEAIAAVPGAIRMGDINIEDGHFKIVDARCWNDNLDEGKDEFAFADRRNAETLLVTSEPAND